jgi:serine/threonine-protein kinase
MPAAFGRYQLHCRLATGGMGEVFLARTAAEGEAGRPVVLKRLLPHLAGSPHFTALFHAEARLASRLHHPHLVEVLETGEVEGMAFVAMEYVAGEELGQLQERAGGGRLPPGVALRVAADVAAGLAHAHRLADAQGAPLGLVHGDVSPRNVLVGPGGEVKLIDFGVARTSSGETPPPIPGALCGTYPYMSPEQAEGRAVDARSDLFSLGTVLWELLTGERLFEGASDLVRLRRVRACRVDAPSSRAAGVPAAVDAVVLRALAREPEARWPDAEAFRWALEEAALGAGLDAGREALAAWVQGLPSPAGVRGAPLAVGAGPQAPALAPAASLPPPAGRAA